MSPTPIQIRAMPPPGLRLVSEKTLDAAQRALMRRVAEESTELYQVPMYTRGGEHVQFTLQQRDEALAALRELNPRLAETWAGERYRYSMHE